MAASPESAAAMPNSCCDQSMYAIPDLRGALMRDRSQTAGPNANCELRIAGLIPACAGAEWRQQRAITTILTDRQLGKSQLRKCHP